MASRVLFQVALVSLAVLLCSLPESSGLSLQKRQSRRVFYAHNHILRRDAARSFCSSLGGRLANHLSLSDMPMLQSVSRNLLHPVLLDARKYNARGYRWSDGSGSPVEPDMWAPFEPNCAGWCSVAFPRGASGIKAINNHLDYHPLCEFKVRDQKQVVQLVHRLHHHNTHYELTLYPTFYQLINGFRP